MVFFAEISFRNMDSSAAVEDTDPARIGEFEPRITSCGAVVGRRVPRARRPAPTPRWDDAIRVRPVRGGMRRGGCAVFAVHR
jgi:hypothetical protein